ncbi:MAG: hypothetical protein NUW37_10870 [Planctomycetes bacterium]|nr:hypothetical protein [Planctomycetota bacterium]
MSLAGKRRSRVMSMCRAFRKRPLRLVESPASRLCAEVCENLWRTSAANRYRIAAE